MHVCMWPVCGVVWITVPQPVRCVSVSDNNLCFLVNVRFPGQCALSVVLYFAKLLPVEIMRVTTQYEYSDTQKKRQSNTTQHNTRHEKLRLESTNSKRDALPLRSLGSSAG